MKPSLIIYNYEEYNKAEAEVIKLSQIIKQVDALLKMITEYEKLSLKTVEQLNLINQKDEYLRQKDLLIKEQNIFGQKLIEHSNIVDIDEPRNYLDFHTFCDFNTKKTSSREFKTINELIGQYRNFYQELKKLSGLTDPEKQRTGFVTLIDQFLNDNNISTSDVHNKSKKIEKILQFFDIFDITDLTNIPSLIQKLMDTLHFKITLLEDQCKELENRIRSLEKAHQSGIQERLKEGVDLRVKTMPRSSSWFDKKPKTEIKSTSIKRRWSIS